MSIAKRFFKPACKVVPNILKNYFKWIRRYSKKDHPEVFDKVYPQFLDMMNHISKALHVEYHVEGLENLDPNDNYYFTANHNGLYDPIVLAENINNPMSFVAKKELSGVPFLANAFKSMGGVFIKREDLKATLRIMRNIEEDMKKDFRSWAIFPEGTRTKDYLKKPIDFHAGTYRAPVHANYPIVPVAIYGSYRVLRSHKVYKHYPVWIKILKPIPVEEAKNMTTEQIAKRCHEEISRTIAFDLRRKDHEEMLKLNKDNYDLYHQY